MPRKGGSMRMGGGSRASSPTRNATYAQAPLSKPAPSSVQSGSQGGMFSGLMGTMATGMAFGAGSEVAHQAVRGLMGGGQSQPMVVNQQPMTQASNQTQQQNMCQFENKQFVECLKSNSDSLGSCQSYFDLLKGCEKSYS